MKDIERFLEDNKNGGRKKIKNLWEYWKQLKNTSLLWFALYLSGISDLYDVVSEVANIYQTVDFLTHDVIENLLKMKDCIKHQMYV